MARQTFMLLCGFLLCSWFPLSLCGAEAKGGCNITGSWQNSLGSVLQLSESGLHIRGCYTSTVESFKGAAGKTMMGRVAGVRNAGADPTIAFSVSWSKGSVSTWAGQCFCKADPPVLRSVWLLRSPATEDEDWKATRIGVDIFYLVKKPWTCDADYDATNQ